MNLVQNAIQKIVNGIVVPQQVLKVAFLGTDMPTIGAPVTISSRLLNTVIRPIVMRDMDVVGGQEIPVDLTGLPVTMADMRTLVYQIPPERTMYRTIISILEASYVPFSSTYTNSYPWTSVQPTSMNTSELYNAADKVFNSHSRQVGLTTTYTEIIGHNTVLIREQTRITGIYSLRCVVGNEENLNNLPLRTLPQFTKLCELATKAYIYNKMVVNLDENFVQFGQQIGKIKEIIESYADAAELYETYLAEQWAAVAYMSDTEKRRRFIKYQMNPGN